MNQSIEIDGLTEGRTRDYIASLNPLLDYIDEYLQPYIVSGNAKSPYKMSALYNHYKSVNCDDKISYKDFNEIMRYNNFASKRTKIGYVWSNLIDPTSDYGIKALEYSNENDGKILDKGICTDYIDYEYVSNLLSDFINKYVKPYIVLNIAITPYKMSDLYNQYKSINNNENIDNVIFNKVMRNNGLIGKRLSMGYVWYNLRNPTQTSTYDYAFKLNCYFKKITPLIYEGIYLLREERFIETNKNIYKIGRSGNIYQRVSHYGNGTIIYLMVACNNSERYESELIKKFCNDFKCVKYYGNEYFMGDLHTMKNTIIDYMKTNINGEIKLINMELKIEHINKETDLPIQKHYQDLYSKAQLSIINN